MSWLLAISLAVRSQDLPPVTKKLFVENATIVSAPGADTFIGHILIEDGIITQVGSSISKPYDAKGIKGDSLYVYPGFIAPLSHIGLKAPKEDQERPKVERTGYPPNDVAGITPDKSIAKLYMGNEGSVGSFRKQGFGIAHSVPHGRMMPGMGSVISLNGASFEKAVIAQDKAMYAQWETARGVFPGTLIGIMAKWREMYKNAEIADSYNKSYLRNPTNKKRPSQDAATTALFPVINKAMPVFFKSEKHRDISRALQLKRDLGFDMVLGEVRDVDRIIDQVAADARVLLSLDLPKEEKEKKGSKDDDKEEDPKAMKMKQLEMRKKAAQTRYVGQARMLAERNIPIAFSYLETKAKDVHTNIRRLVKDGLSTSAALAALTTEPARVLGISAMAGTLQRGKMGNLVMTTGPLFEDDSKIKMVVVDGVPHVYEVKEKKKKSSGDEEVVDASGEWAYTIDVPGMTPSGTMTFSKSDDTYDLVVTNNQAPGESVETSGIEMEGSNMVFSYKMDAGGMKLTIDNDITFDGDTFEGTVSVGDFGTFDITGSKSTPE